jgi:CHAP domain
VNGPDVEAYKRAVWRLGRWPGPASRFDRAFSNAFSHGRSGNAAETGLAGVQRQANLDDTGWLGEKTFNLLRSVLIPEGIPNGPGKPGEHAMDAYAQSLLVEAWEEFEGEEPKPPPMGSVRDAALRLAVGELGTVESPAGSNRTKYGAWYGMDGNPWCAMFTTWAYELGAGELGTNSPPHKKGVSYAYVPYIVGDARAKRNGLSVTSAPVAGDLVCYDWAGDGTFDHVGLFERWGGGSQFNAVEGNTSASDYSNGGQVLRCTRSTGGQSTVFVRVAEP